MKVASGCRARLKSYREGVRVAAFFSRTTIRPRRVEGRGFWPMARSLDTVPPSVSRWRLLPPSNTRYSGDRPKAALR